MNRLRRAFKENKTFVLAIGFLVVFSVSVSYAVPPAQPYNPGETLDPNCAPGESNCTVAVSGGGASQWDTVGGGINYAGGNVGIGTTTPQSALDVNGNITGKELTISGIGIGMAAPTNAQASIQYDPSAYSYNNDGHETIYHIYSYENYGGGRIYSSSFAEVAVTDNGDQDARYAVTVSWDAVDGADGYKILFSQYGGGYDNSYDIATPDNSFVDGDYSVSSTNDVGVSPSTVFTNSNNINGSTTFGGNVSIDGSIVSNGSIVSSGTHTGTGGSSDGAGTRMMWIPSKSAFRAGSVSADQWDDANIGDYSIALGTDSVASGLNSTAFGGSTNAQGYYSTAFGYHTSAAGGAATALGLYTTASGDYSTALGYQTTASGSSSTAFGIVTTASGSTATAFGTNTIASGDYSTALGDTTVAAGNNSVSFGYGTYASTTSSAAFGEFNNGGSLFEIGNGTDDSNRSNALTLTSGGDLYVSGNITCGGTCGGTGGGGSSQWNDIPNGLGYNGGLIVTGTLNSYADVPNVNTTAALMWIPGRGSFRASSSSEASWDDSTKLGYNSALFGFNTSASGGYAIASGFEAVASGDGSVALGIAANAIGSSSVSLGQYNFATGSNSLALGTGSTASGTSSIAIGISSVSSGLYSAAFGYATKAQSYNSATFGRYNIGGGDPTNWVPTDSLFEVGNGTEDNNRSNALTVYKNGDAKIGAEIRAGNLNILGTNGGVVTAPSNAQATIDYTPSGGNFNTGNQFSYKVYGYRTVNGIRTYSSSYAEASVTDNGQADSPYNINVSWDPSPDAEGYRVLFGSNGFEDVAGYDTTSTSFVDGDYSITPSEDASARVVTPTSIFSNMNNINGSLTINGNLSAVGATFSDMVLATGAIGAGVMAGDLGAGTRMQWIPSSSAFRAGTVTADQWDSANIGMYSTAFGKDAVASGISSFAMGENGAIASGDNSFAVGQNSVQATGINSFAMGNNGVTASGDQSFAFGNNGTTASGASSFAIGLFGTTASGQYSFAIGSSASASATDSIAIGRTARAQDTGAMAFGYDGIASGLRSLAVGTSQALGIRAITLSNNQAIASGENSTALGYNTQATGTGSTAFGTTTHAIGIGSTAFGKDSSAEGDFSTAFGQGVASGYFSTAFSLNNTASGNYSTAFGQSSTASGNNSTAIGIYTKAEAYGTFVIGRENVGGGTSNAWLGTDSLFEIGNGDSTGETETLSNAMTVLKNGNVGIQTPTPGYLLQVGNGTTAGIVARFQNTTGTCDINPTTSSLVCSSDMNLKKNRELLADGSPWNFNSNISFDNQNVLSKIMALRPVQYNWNSELDTATKHPGFIAQEVEQIFPQLVSTDPDTGLKSLNYTGLIPFTVQAIQDMNLNITKLSDLDRPNTWRESLISWFGSTTNGIQNIFSKKVTTDQLCVHDADGETCLNRSQINQILGSHPSSGSGSSTPTPPVADEPVVTPEEPVVEEPVIVPEVQPEPTPAPVVDPAPVETPAE